MSLSKTWPRWASILALLAALAIGVGLGRIGGRKETAPETDAAADQTTAAGPGAWGRLSYVPISIECPEELLPVRAFETKVTHWILRGYTTEKFLLLLGDLGLTLDLRTALRSPEVLHITETGLDLTPTPNIILNLPPDARKKIYTILAGFPENGSSLIFVQTKTVEERFAGSGVSASTVALFRRLTCEYGRYLIFSDVQSIFTVIPTAEERAHFLKALTRQPTMMVRLQVTRKTNLEALLKYWGKGGRAKAARPLLESLARLPDGAWMDLTHLLPPTAAALLYSFPQPENSLDGAPVRKDCHYTSFNFFRDPPETHFANEGFLASQLKTGYSAVPSDPHYGDLVLFFTPRGQIVHSAVYLADNIVYTKNGDTSLHPWMLSTVQDLIDQYSFQVPLGEALQVKFFRSKEP